jgi:hypothetical protein
VTYKGRDLVAEETVLFDIKPGNGISMIRNVVKTVGSGTVENALNQA